MTANLFGEPGAENLYDDPHTVWGNNEEYWPERWDEDPTIVFEIEEWTAKPLRAFIQAATIIDRVAEYDIEEYLDEDGRTLDQLEEAAKDPAVIAAFDAALDLLFAKTTYRWAYEMVLVHKVAFNPDDPSNPLYDGDRMFKRAPA